MLCTYLKRNIPIFEFNLKNKLLPFQFFNILLFITLFI
ncbi:hypothetical protein LEP1GSC137_4560 [Leptospira borgpetersenii str. Noumea 25]|nr:hypothetical protein LEP1GSC121_1372 [Leptospira borgpetersenii serovar Castellonis str. 200801910]EMO10406.1 hypothetical protein LEP1GSC137_4560 [Leptospira borgpetersenii str. Noumea 25]